MKTLRSATCVLLVLSSTVLISCNKDKSFCSTCFVKDNAGTVTKNYGEKCGTATDIENYEASAKADASQLNGTFSCSRKYSVMVPGSSKPT